MKYLFLALFFIMGCSTAPQKIEPEPDLGPCSGDGFQACVYRSEEASAPAPLNEPAAPQADDLQARDLACLKEDFANWRCQKENAPEPIKHRGVLPRKAPLPPTR